MLNLVASKLRLGQLENQGKDWEKSGNNLLNFYEIISRTIGKFWQNLRKTLKNPKNNLKTF
jgi:hypothetical protein